jgi:hypothetical protein
VESLPKVARKIRAVENEMTIRVMAKTEILFTVVCKFLYSIVKTSNSSTYIFSRKTIFGPSYLNGVVKVLLLPSLRKIKLFHG